jgi:hypothetical protein
MRSSPGTLVRPLLDRAKRMLDRLAPNLRLLRQAGCHPVQDRVVLETGRPCETSRPCIVCGGTAAKLGVQALGGHFRVFLWPKADIRLNMAVAAQMPAAGGKAVQFRHSNGEDAPLNVVGTRTRRHTMGLIPANQTLTCRIASSPATATGFSSDAGSFDRRFIQPDLPR